MFYASIVDDAFDEGESVCEPSGSFRWRARNGSDEARAAHRDIVSRLEAAGWTIDRAEADPWYATSFTRTVLAPREQPPVDDLFDEDDLLEEVEAPVPEPPAPEPPIVPPPESEPEPLPPAPALPPPAASPRGRLRVDVWRITAVAGLAAAAAVAVWLAVHDGVALP